MDAYLAKTLVAMAVTLSPAMSFAATYYVRADGQAQTKGEATGCGSASTALDLPLPGSMTFSPGDIIVLCHEGGVFRAGLTVSSNGTSGSPITYDGRGTAVVSGADLVTGWSPDVGSVYQATVDWEPQQVFVDGVFANRKPNRSEVTSDLDWYWDSGTSTLYLYDDAGNPDGRQSPGVEAGRRGNAITMSEKEHIVITGVQVAHANTYGIFTWISSHVTVRQCILEWNWHAGFASGSNVGYSHITVEDSIARYNGSQGITAILGGGTASYLTYRRNQAYENGTYQGEDYEPQHAWTGGIKAWGPSGMTHLVVEHNEVHHNGYAGGPTGNGIWFDFASATSADDANIIRHNLVYENQKNGIFIESSNYCHVYGNVLYDNAKIGEQGVYTNAGIRVDARQDSTADHNRVYNNTVVGGQHGIHLSTYNPGAGLSISNNEVKNNIFVGTVSAKLRADTGGDNDGVYGSGNVYENNALGPEGADFVYWGGWMSTYAEWEAAYGGSTASIREDPLLHDVGAHQYWLRDGSPAIDAGLDLGADFAMALHSTSSWPDAVVLGDQATAGSGWEVGAYVFGDPCVPTTCEVEGADCGSLDDGCGAQLDCGTCTAPEVCGGTGTPNVCGPDECVPATCEQLGSPCGLVPDECGGELDCGPCGGGSEDSSGCDCRAAGKGRSGGGRWHVAAFPLMIYYLRRRKKRFVTRASTPT